MDAPDIITATVVIVLVIVGIAVVALQMWSNR